MRELCARTSATFQLLARPLQADKFIIDVGPPDPPAKPSTAAAEDGIEAPAAERSPLLAGFRPVLLRVPRNRTKSRPPSPRTPPAPISVFVPGQFRTHLIERMRQICVEEGIEADDESLSVIAQAGEGSVRDSLSALDQAIACCGNIAERHPLCARCSARFRWMRWRRSPPHCRIRMA